MRVNLKKNIYIDLFDSFRIASLRNKNITTYYFYNSVINIAYKKALGHCTFCKLRVKPAALA